MTSCDLIMAAIVLCVLAGVWGGNELICRALVAESMRLEVLGLLVLVLSSLAGVVLMAFLLNGRLHTLCAV